MRWHFFHWFSGTSYNERVAFRGSPDNVRGKDVFYKCLIPCKVITLHT